MLLTLFYYCANSANSEISMFSENTQKQLQLISGIITTLAALIGGVAGIFGKITAFDQFPPWAAWIAYVALFLLGLWLLIKWRTRYSRLLRPDALRLERDNAEHLVGRSEDIQNLLQQCLARQIVFLEGESGSGKSALVRSGLIPRLKDDKSILPLLLADLWVDQWEPTRALKIAVINSGAFGPNAALKPTEGEGKPVTRPLSTLADIENQLARLNDEEGRTALIIFDQFDAIKRATVNASCPTRHGSILGPCGETIHFGRQWRGWLAGTGCAAFSSLAAIRPLD
jgi:hypothetical protein